MRYRATWNQPRVTASSERASRKGANPNQPLCANRPGRPGQSCQKFRKLLRTKAKQSKTIALAKMRRPTATGSRALPALASSADVCADMSVMRPPKGTLPIGHADPVIPVAVTRSGASREAPLYCATYRNIRIRDPARGCAEQGSLGRKSSTSHPDPAGRHGSCRRFSWRAGCGPAPTRKPLPQLRRRHRKSRR